MSKRPRQKHSPAFKAKVALAAVKGERRCMNWRSSLTFTLIRSRSGVVSFWKGLPVYFAVRRGARRWSRRLT